MQSATSLISAKGILVETPIGTPLPSQEVPTVSLGRMDPMPWIHCTSSSLVKNESATLSEHFLYFQTSLWGTLLLFLNLGGHIQTQCHYGPFADLLTVRGGSLQVLWIESLCPPKIQRLKL